MARPTAQGQCGSSVRARVLLWEVHGAPRQPTLSGSFGSKRHLRGKVWQVLWIMIADMIKHRKTNMIWAMSKKNDVRFFKTTWTRHFSRLCWCFLLQHFIESTSSSCDGDHVLPSGQFDNMSKTFSIKHASGKCSWRSLRHCFLLSTWGPNQTTTFGWHDVTCHHILLNSCS